MTKADRLEFEQRRDALDHWARLSLDTCLNYGLTSKSKWLAEQRSKTAEDLAAWYEHNYPELN